MNYRYFNVFWYFQPRKQQKSLNGKRKRFVENENKIEREKNAR